MAAMVSGSGSITVPAGQYMSVTFANTVNGMVEYNVEDMSGGTVDIYIIPESSFQKMVPGQQFAPLSIRSHSNISGAGGGFEASEGDYRLVVVNNGPTDQKIFYSYFIGYNPVLTIVEGLFIPLAIVLVVIVVVIFIVMRYQGKTNPKLPYPPLPTYPPQPERGQVKYCQYCGKQIPFDGAHCPYCGQRQN